MVGIKCALAETQYENGKKKESLRNGSHMSIYHDPGPTEEKETGILSS